ncbi:hypothetical protein FAIPA1_180009 [Frankia sp. AiPs1]|uniref:phosphopantetheine-binding protein n=1 Tax=Frankia sp. AiPa1 TaxID=573492 RepID=UPI00202B9B31|nr:phosphopantetheine-binding protein [Frankia sp. AiPa1]MCL9762956.1 phosphopantetheine-binding protein [Frankia sp. AiPa1]
MAEAGDNIPLEAVLAELGDTDLLPPELSQAVYKVVPRLLLELRQLRKLPVDVRRRVERLLMGWPRTPGRITARRSWGRARAMVRMGVVAVRPSVERLPLMADGRVDRASLPAPEFEDERYRPPRNGTERVLAKVFAEVLELDRVGIDEDFFDLGGDSLRAIRLVGLIRTELHHEVSIRTLLMARTIAGLTEMWEDLARPSTPALRRRTQHGEVL